MGALYKLTSPSGKSYIGITIKTMDARWGKHVEHALGKRDNGALYAALRKYGPESFTRELLAECDDWGELCQMEIAAIREHKTFAPNGYNLTTGGEGIPGPRSEETKRRISVAQKKRYQRPEERERLRQAGIKGNQSENAVAVREAKKAAAAKRRADRRLSKKERSARIREGMAVPEVRQKMLAAAKARTADPEWRKRISKSKKGAKMPPRSPEWRAMIAEMRRKEWADPEMRAKRLAILAAAREAKKKRGASG